MLRRGHRRFGRPRIDDDDLRLMRIPHHALPEDRMGDAQVAADEHDHVRLFEVGVGVGRGIEAERLLVRHDRRGHALPRVAVAVQHAHAELGQRAEQRHFLGDDLAGAQEGDRLRAVRGLDRLHAIDERAERRVPIDGLELAGRVAQQRRRRAIGRSRARPAPPSPLGQAMPRFTG